VSPSSPYLLISHSSSCGVGDQGVLVERTSHPKLVRRSRVLSCARLSCQVTEAHDHPCRTWLGVRIRSKFQGIPHGLPRCRNQSSALSRHAESWCFIVRVRPRIKLTRMKTFWRMKWIVERLSFWLWLDSIQGRSLTQGVCLRR
jgi:hypothetical protein